MNTHQEIMPSHYQSVVLSKNITLFFDKGKKKTSVEPRIVTILSCKNGSPNPPTMTFDKRCLYHWNNLDAVLVYSDDTIAPAHFCNKVAKLLDYYRIPFPVIPLMNSQYPELAVDCVIGSHEIIFSEKYAQADEHPFLTFIIGHELGHRYNHYMHMLHTSISQKTKLFDLFYARLTLYVTVICFGEIIYPDSYSYILGLYSLIEAYYMFFTRKKAHALQNIELTCDATAVEIFGRTPEEKKEMAQEGINCFLHNIAQAPYGNALDDALERLKINMRIHPSDRKRIYHLEQIIAVQNDIITRNADAKNTQ